MIYILNDHSNLVHKYNLLADLLQLCSEHISKSSISLSRIIQNIASSLRTSFLVYMPNATSKLTQCFQHIFSRTSSITIALGHHKQVRFKTLNNPSPNVDVKLSLLCHTSVVHNHPFVFNEQMLDKIFSTTRS